MTEKPVKIRDNRLQRYCEVWVHGQPVLGPDGLPSRYRYEEWYPLHKATDPSSDAFEQLGRRVLKAVTC